MYSHSDTDPTLPRNGTPSDVAPSSEHTIGAVFPAPGTRRTLRGTGSCLSDRYVCIHGHFYQPPREDPVTGEVPVEVEAAPFHDFNEKITAECYKPNADEGNFARMSFNIGPTLVSWLRAHHPEVLTKIAAGDRDAVDLHGMGAAMAQSYHHTILPLATARDRQTEIRWGIRSFELLFGRRPLGIWLPETAVDSPTLEDCADEGLQFTILSPTQVMVAGEAHGSYRIDLPSGRVFDAVVYDAGLGGSVSFDPGATMWAETFAHDQILPIFRRIITRPSLVAIATDGEVYGHHHKFKDLFLRELLEHKLAAIGLTPLTAEQYVARFPAQRRAMLREQTSWGCTHHLARWSSGCACTAGPATWKQPLRDAFDALATLADDIYELMAPAVLRDHWAARDAYIDVVEGASPFDSWYAAWQPDGHADPRRAQLLLEAQRHRLAMYASCAFYWEDVGRIEPGYGIKQGLAAAHLLDHEYGSALAESFRRDLTNVIGWRSAKSAAELHAGG